MTTYGVYMASDVCQVSVIHEERLEEARAALPETDAVERLSALYKLLGDPHRLRILLALERCELCVCDLAALLGSTPSALSHQLRLLRGAGLVRFRREGKMAFYRPGKGGVSKLLEAGLRALEKEE